MQKRRQLRGFSLIELLIAMGVIAVGLLGVAASLTFGSRQSGHGEKMLIATNQARIILEAIGGRSLLSNPPLAAGNLPPAASGINDGANDRRALTAPPFDNPDEHPDILPGVLDQFTRRIRLTRRGLDGTPGEFLVNTEVTIFWKEKGVERSVTTTAVLATSAGIP